MDEDWDADGFEPKEIKVASKWDDEDADDDVKDNWEDDEEEEKKDTEKQEEKSTVAPAPAKKNKKTLSKKIEEKEEKERSAQLAMEAKKSLSPEEKLAEKKRQQQLQEAADLQAAIDTFGIKETGGSGIDASLPSSKEDFDEFEKALVKKIIPFSNSQHYPLFVEDLVRDICANMNSNDLKKLKNTIENLHLEKTKIEKGDKKKKSAKGKAKLRVEGDSAALEYSAYDVDEFDDFI